MESKEIKKDNKIIIWLLVGILLCGVFFVGKQMKAEKAIKDMQKQSVIEGNKKQIKAIDDFNADPTNKAKEAKAKKAMYGD